MHRAPHRRPTRSQAYCWGPACFGLAEVGAGSDGTDERVIVVHETVRHVQQNFLISLLLHCPIGYSSYTLMLPNCFVVFVVYWSPPPSITSWFAGDIQQT
jgi:hypothetical protein